MNRLKLKVNSPFDVGPLKELFVLEEEVLFLPPGATYPLGDSEWNALFLDSTNVSLLLYSDESLAGHFGLVPEEHLRFRLVFFYVARKFRGTGVAAEIVERAERFARDTFNARELSLNVQDFNPRAIRLYQRCGFREVSRSGTTIYMAKTIY